MAVRYIGNKRKKEFHQARKSRQTPDCQIPEIKKQVEFRIGADAIRDGYDPCVHCCKHWKSRR